jgi:hypothetical protein
MKTVARALLRWIVNYYPKPQLEIGRGMLTELEELHGWQALEWAFGGIQFYLELKGASMIKDTLGISSVMILAILASWLYANHQLEFSIGVLVVGVIVAALSQPKQAFWFALIFAMMLPVTHLTQAYMFSSNMFHELTAYIAAPGSITWVTTSDRTQEKPSSYIMVDANSTVNLQITGSMTTEATNALKATYNTGNTTPNNWNEFSSLFENQPVKLAMFGFPIAFLLTGLTLLLRSRFTKSSPLAM